MVTNPRHRAGLPSRAASVLLLVPLLAVTACDVPTDLPVVVQRWVLPVGDTELGVEEVVPSTVTIRDGSFVIDLPPASASASLGDVCGECAALDGTFVSSMPAFTAEVETPVPLPADVEGGTVTGGSVELSVRNGLSFDPIEGGGSITLRLSDATGGVDLAEVVLDGSTSTLAPGTTWSPTVDLAAGTIGSALIVEAVIESVGGQSATVDLQDEITVSLASAELLLSSVTVVVGTTDVAFDTVEVDVDEFSTHLTDGILEGSVILEVTNPFAVTIDGTLDLGGTSKPVTIESTATSTVRVDYTGDELRSFIGEQRVLLSGAGTATGGTITVTPDEVLPVEASLDVLVEVGDEG